MNVRKSLSRCITAALVVGSGLTVFSNDASASIPTSAPSTIVSRSIADAESASWVHEVISASTKGHTFSANNEIGAFDGQQIIRTDGAKAEVILVNDIAYIEANAKGVADYFELTTEDPHQLAGKWLSVTPADSGYSTYIAAVTLKSDFSQLQFLGPYTSGTKTTITGRSVIPVHGYVAGSSNDAKISATLYVTATGKTLPIKFVISDKTVHETTIWSDWSHPVYLSTPTDSQPIPNQ